MNLLERLEMQPFIEVMGWTLFHFVWQGAVIGAIVAVTLACLRGRSASARYLAACAGMFFMLAAPILTMAVLLARGGAPAPAHATFADAVPVAVPSLAGRIDAIAPALTLIWIVGTAACHLRYIVCWFGAQRLRACDTSPIGAALSASLSSLRDELAVRPDVRILRSSLARVPMVIGWLRPVVLLPIAVIETLTPAQLRAVVAHELAHVRRHDYLVNLVQAGFESLLFYHPAVWWLSGRIRTEREYCCDDLAARVCGDTICYARALATLDELRAESCAPALAATGGSLMNRITRLLGVRPAPRTSYRAGTAAWLAPATLSGVLIAGVSAVGVAAPDVIHVDDDVHVEGEHAHRDTDVRERERADDDRRRAVRERRGDAADLIEIVRQFDAVQAEMLALLREAGFEKRELTDMLRYLGTDKRVLGDIERTVATRAKLDALDARMAAAKAKVEAAVEAGKMTADEARARLHHMALDSDTMRAQMIEDREREGAMHRRVLEDAVEAGRLSEEEARLKLGLMREKLGERMRRHRAPAGEHRERRMRDGDERARRPQAEEMRERGVADDAIRRESYRERLEDRIARMRDRLEGARESDRGGAADQMRERLAELEAVLEKLRSER